MNDESVNDRVAGCEVLMVGCWLLVAGYWLLVAGYWLLVTCGLSRYLQRKRESPQTTSNQ